jgi:hypothetical protein
MLEPFSKRARPWERHAAALRRLAGNPDSVLLDPWQLAPKVGLTVVDGNAGLAFLNSAEQQHLQGSASRSWSGGVLPLPLPDGGRICILNPLHPVRRNKITLMEEISHTFLKHRPTAVTLRAGVLQVRDFDADQESEAYGVGAAALIPLSRLFSLINRGPMSQPLLRCSKLAMSSWPTGSKSQAHIACSSPDSGALRRFANSLRGGRFDNGRLSDAVRDRFLQADLRGPIWLTRSSHCPSCRQSRSYPTNPLKVIA